VPLLTSSVRRAGVLHSPSAGIAYASRSHRAPDPRSHPLQALESFPMSPLVLLSLPNLRASLVREVAGFGAPAFPSAPGSRPARLIGRPGGPAASPQPTGGGEPASATADLLATCAETRGFLYPYKEQIRART